MVPFVRAIGKIKSIFRVVNEIIKVLPNNVLDAAKGVPKIVAVP